MKNSSNKTLLQPVLLTDKEPGNSQFFSKGPKNKLTTPTQAQRQFHPLLKSQQITNSYNITLIQSLPGTLRGQANTSRQNQAKPTKRAHFQTKSSNNQDQKHAESQSDCLKSSFYYNGRTFNQHTSLMDSKEMQTTRQTNRDPRLESLTCMFQLKYKLAFLLEELRLPPDMIINISKMDDQNELLQYCFGAIKTEFVRNSQIQKQWQATVNAYQNDIKNKGDIMKMLNSSNNLLKDSETRLREMLAARTKEWEILYSKYQEKEKKLEIACHQVWELQILLSQYKQYMRNVAKQSHPKHVLLEQNNHSQQSQTYVLLQETLLLKQKEIIQIRQKLYETNLLYKQTLVENTVWKNRCEKLLQEIYTVSQRELLLRVDKSSQLIEEGYDCQITLSHSQLKNNSSRLMQKVQEQHRVEVSCENKATNADPKTLSEAETVLQSPNQAQTIIKLKSTDIIESGEEEEWKSIVEKMKDIHKQSIGMLKRENEMLSAELASVTAQLRGLKKAVGNSY